MSIEFRLEDGTYTLEAVATLVGFGTGQIAQPVVLALDLFVVAVMEGCLWSANCLRLGTCKRS